MSLRHCIRLGRGTARAASALLLMAALAGAALLGWTGTTMAQAGGQPAPAAPGDVWPREVKLGGATALVYQPQVESWQGNVLAFRAVVVVKPAGSAREVFGTIWATARTEVDRVARMVALQDVTLTKSDFPTLPDHGASYLRALQKDGVPARTITIALDRLEASLAASGMARPVGVEVSNAPPRVIVSESPAILVPIDGAPVQRPIAGTRFERLINTRALIVREAGGTTYYLHVYDGWLYAGALTGPWYRLMVAPAGIDAVAQNLARSGAVDLLDGAAATPKPSLAQGVPAIFVSETPAELIVFRGAPTFTPIPGTGLQWASNTTADVIFDAGGKDYYVLLSGRWYRAPALTGAWTYVASTALPADFRRIPVDTPAGVVLASVAGTPQAQAALIANSIPQTATIPRVNGPAFVPSFDGPPELRPIAGTPMYYVANSATPIINVSLNLYYALQAGVWFSATTLAGPWYVAAWVPPVVYTIPPTSPLYYVTFVHVYGSTAQVVYVGYTPGYLGTVVTPAGVVVYGTGYAYPTWVGTVWYPPPATYGTMAQPVYNPAAGMAFGFAMGVTTAALVSSTYYHPAYYGYPCCGTTTGSVYGRYGNVTWSGTRTYSSYSDGTLNERAGGTYTNERTGTTGTYAASQSYNTETGNAQRNETRSFNTTSGGSGTVTRNQSYDASTDRYTYDKTTTGTGPGGMQVSSQRDATVAPGQAGMERQTTVTNPNTGATTTTDVARGANSQGGAAGRQTTYTNPTTGQSQTNTSGVARQGNNLYADHDGNVYRNSGSGWQKQTTSGDWQTASGDTSWANREQQARSSGEDRFSSFRQSGASGGGGWGDRFGGGGGWGGRFGRFRR